MKKQYSAPTITTAFIGTQQMICGSITETESGLSVTLDNSEGSFGDDNTINSRRGGGFWDD